MDIFHRIFWFLLLAAWWSSSVLFSLGVFFTRKICPVTEVCSKGFQPIWFTIMFPTMMFPATISAWTMTWLGFPSTVWTTSVRCFCQVMGQSFAKVMTLKSKLSKFVTVSTYLSVWPHHLPWVTLREKRLRICYFRHELRRSPLGLHYQLGLIHHSWVRTVDHCGKVETNSIDTHISVIPPNTNPMWTNPWMNVGLCDEK